MSGTGATERATMNGPVCADCGRRVDGRYVQALGKTWHPDHFRCAACGKALRAQGCHVQNGAAYHPGCYLQALAPRCAYCHRPLAGRYLVDYWGTRYCAEHQGVYPHCQHCGRLVPEVTTPKASCGTCRATAVTTVAQAQPLFARLVGWVKSQGLEFGGVPLHVELPERARLTHLMGGTHGGRERGVTLLETRVWRDGRRKTQVQGVAILTGLPAIVFAGVAVHELGHAWMGVHEIAGLPDWANEGFCNVLTFRMYSQQTDAESRYHLRTLEENRDPVYGDGFRRVRAIVDRQGFGTVVQTLRETGQLPAG